MSTKNIQVAYMNAGGETDYDSAFLSDIGLDTFRFSWTATSAVSSHAGTISISVEFSEANELDEKIYVWKTKPTTINVESSFSVLSDAIPLDYSDLEEFYNTNSNSVVRNISDMDEPIYISNRRILLPILEDIVVSGDNISQVVTFVIPRFFDNIDLSEKVITIKYINANGQGDRASIVNMVVSDETIAFGWLIDSKVTVKSGSIDFAIEVIGYDESNQFYCWQTTPAQIFVEQGLEVDGLIVEPLPSWIQSWEIEKNEVVSVTRGYRDEAESARDEAEQYATALSNVYNKQESDKRYANILVGKSHIGKEVSVDDIAPTQAITAVKLYGESRQDNNPLPDNPVPMIDIIDPTLSIAGKNLFSVNWELGSIDNAGNNQAWAIAARTSFIKILPNQQYTVSFTIEGYSDFPDFGLFFYDKNKTFLYSVTDHYNVSKLTFTSPDNAEYVRFRTFRSGGLGLIPKTSQMEIGNAVTQYTDYIETRTIEFNEETTELVSGVNIGGIPLDAGALEYTYIDKDGVKWMSNSIESNGDVVEYVERCKIVSYEDGAEFRKNNETQGDGLFLYYNTISSAKAIASSQIMCTHAPSVLTVPGAIVGTIASASGSIYVNFGDYDTNTTLDNFFISEYNKGTPVTFKYQLATPIRHDITDTPAGRSLLNVYGNYPTTVILSDSNTQITYSRDINKAFAELQNAIISLGGI